MTAGSYQGLLRSFTIAVGVLVALTACAPAGLGPAREQGSKPTSSAKTLQVAISSDAEPTEFGLALGRISAGGSEPMYMVHAPLTIYDEKGTLQPRIAERVPTVENGDWAMQPDGRMELTWKLRPDARWHDGTALSADDLLFGYLIAMDPEWGLGTRTLRDVTRVKALDQHTVVIEWKKINIYANEMGLNTIAPLANHRLAALYEGGDKQAFAASSYWSDQFIGLGPYRMSEWVRGSHINLAANDDYFLGRPKIDRVTIRYFGDTRSLLVATMAGDIDVVPVGSMKAEEAHLLRTEWESKGAGSITISENKLRNGDFQWRDPGAPWVQDVRVRQAMVHLLDRQSQVETLHNGLSAVDDIMLPKQHPAYKLAQQRALPKLGYDVDRAHRLFAEAGLTRGPDGLYRTAAGTPVALELSSTNDINTNVQELLTISNAWKTAGLDPTNVFITSAMDKDAVRGQSKGVILTSTTLGYSAFNSYIASEIRSEATRWKGSNIGGYTNPAYDQLQARLLSTISASERDQIAADLVKMQLDNMTYLPLVYSADVSAHRTGVRGITAVLPDQRINAWNVHLWEIA